jgi:hypothetical protein
MTTATRVTTGHEFACALLSNGTAKCWGLGESGQRGDGSFSTFALVAGRGERPHRRGGARRRLWPRLRAALERDDALLGRERRRATRKRDHRQSRHRAAGDGDRLSGVTAFTTGAYHTCALLGNGTLRAGAATRDNSATGLHELGDAGGASPD